MRNISIKRIGLLLSKFFIDNRRTELIRIITGFAVVLFVSYCSLHSPVVVVSDTLAMFFGIALILIIGWSASIFTSLKNKDKAIQYLLLPATTLEKTITNILLVHVYVPVAVFVIFAGGILLGYVLPSPIADKYTADLCFNFLQDDAADKVGTFLTILFCQSTMLFASVYFKKRALLKAVAVYAVVICVEAIIVVSVFLGLLTHFNFIGEKVVSGCGDFNLQYATYELCRNILLVAGTVLFWVLSYFRLRETEV
ncbi:MAG: hypothetical protein LBR36_06310 [Bacteroidales bacterium]|jgi:hypothetical protein|nr:hypothetical protein [Bacteroidales bacterium]